MFDHNPYVNEDSEVEEAWNIKQLSLLLKI